jgi:uncharacterized membrane protein
MNHDPSLISTVLFLLSPGIIVVAVPLILRLVKMNGAYGVRIPESFRSEARWYEINRLGGVLLLVWGVAVGVTAVIGVIIDRSHWFGFCLLSAGVVIGGPVLMVIAIFVYAAKTRKK